MNPEVGCEIPCPVVRELSPAMSLSQGWGTLVYFMEQSIFFQNYK